MSHRCAVVAALGIVFCGLVASERVTSADVLLESYEADRPVDAEELLRPFRTGMEAGGVHTRAPEILASPTSHLPLPAVKDPALTSSELAGRINIGYDAASKLGKDNTSPNFAAAIVLLEAAITASHDNAATVCVDKRSREYMTRAYAGLVYAHLRLAQDAKTAAAKREHVDAAAAAMTEQIRSYPDFPLSPDKYWDSVAKFSANMHDTLDVSPHGALEIRIDRPNAKIFVNEFERGESSAHLVNVVPGTYRVVVIVDGVARLYLVDVAATAKELAIDWEADTSLVITRDGWVGYLWPRGHDRSAAAGPERARASAPDAVYLAGITWSEGRRFVTGAKYQGDSPNAKVSGAVQLTGDHDDGKLAALARYLTHDHAQRPVEIVDVPASPNAHTREADTRAAATRTPNVEPGSTRPTRWPMWIAGVAAVGAFAGGGYLLHLDGKSTCGSSVAFNDCRTMYDEKLRGWSTVGAGAVSLAFGVIWYLYTRESAPISIGVAHTSERSSATIELSLPF